ncbi:MAG: diacylglycerol kinase family protein [Chitinophagaceae bacterium]
MNIATLYHNPGAGDEEHGREELIMLIEECGFQCRYSSSNSLHTKELDAVDFIIVAGGDGTIRNFTKGLLGKKSLQYKPPIALLPHGTANNIAKTLQIEGDTKSIIQSWHNSTLKKFDVGVIKDDSLSLFFLESFGCGIFPYLMLEMKKHGEKYLKADEKMDTALQLLHKILQSYEPRHCELEIDGVDHSGKFLLAEIMNTRSIGPNLFLSPQGDPGDGIMEVVVVPEKDKDKFASYVQKKINGIEEVYLFQILRASQKIVISWEGTHVHVDDENVTLKKSETITIEIKKGLLEFKVS